MLRYSVFFFLVMLSIAHTPNEWSKRTIYQLLTDRFAQSTPSSTPCSDLSTYCGGDYDGLTSKLDYISNLGFDAIWISPIVKNTPGGYHGYWLEDLYALNDNFGDSDSLKRLVDSCHSRNMWVMLDIVGNHVGPCPNDDFSHISPFNSSVYYHTKCQITDWNNQTEVEVCRLANLPDLKQEYDAVSNILVDWIKNVIKQYKFDGIRVDTAREVPKWFWTRFTDNANVYTIGEILDGRTWLVSEYQGCLSATLSYPLAFSLRNVFMSHQSMYQIEATYKDYAKYFSDVSVLGTFIDNHDLPRFLQQGSMTQYKSALVFVLTSIGVPIVYYGTEQSYSGGADPNNRESLWPNYDQGSELYVYIQKVVAWRMKYGWNDEEQVQNWADDTFYAFTRGKTLACFTNGDEEQQRTLTYLPHFGEGDKLCNLFDENDCIRIENGATTVTLNGGLPKLYR